MQFFGACRPTIAAKDRPSTRRPKKQPTAQEPALEPTTGEAGVAEQAVVAEQAGLAEDTALTQDEDAAPIPEVREPQRFPQLALLDVASQISRELAEDERNPAQTRQAVERLRAALTPAALKPGERDYLQTLTSFLAGAFESMSTPLAASQKRPTTKGLFSEEDTEVSKHAKDDTRGKHPKSQTATAEDEETIDQSSDGFR